MYLTIYVATKAKILQFASLFVGQSLIVLATLVIKMLIAVVNCDFANGLDKAFVVLLYLMCILGLCLTDT